MQKVFEQKEVKKKDVFYVECLYANSRSEEFSLKDIEVLIDNEG